MLVLNPEIVKFGSAVWSDVKSISIDRTTDRLVAERSDTGPHLTFVDVAEQRVTISAVRPLLRDQLGSPAPSDEGDLIFYASPSKSDALRRRVKVMCVVTSVKYDIGKNGAAIQTTTLIAMSADGAADPITIEDASDGVV